MGCERGIVDDLMLHVRAVALVEQRRLLAKGDPWEMRACPLRFPPGDGRRNGTTGGDSGGKPPNANGPVDDHRLVFA